MRDGDRVRVDAIEGRLDVLEEGFADRPPVAYDGADAGHGVGRELFSVFRNTVGLAEDGASVVV